MRNGSGPSAAWWVFQTIIAGVALLALALSGIQYWHRPMEATIRVVDVTHKRLGPKESQVSASLVFVNTGKRDLIVAGAFLTLDSGQLCPWISPDEPKPGLPFCVRAERAELLTVCFDTIRVDMLMANTPPGPTRYVKARLSVAVVDRDAALRDVELHGISLSFGEDKSLGGSFSIDRGVATLDDMSETPSLLSMLTM